MGICNSKILNALRSTSMPANALAKELGCSRQVLDPALDALLDSGQLRVLAVQGEDAVYTAADGHQVNGNNGEARQ